VEVGTYRYLKQPHMNQLGANSHSPVQHLPNERLNLWALMVIKPDEQLEQIQ